MPNMKALRYHGNKDIRLDEIAEPEVRPGYIKIKNGWAGVCGMYTKYGEVSLGPNGLTSD